MRLGFRTGRVRKRVWNAGRLFVLAAALAVTFGVFFLAAVRVTTRAREVNVPDIRGRSITEAQAALDTVGLVIRVDDIRRPDPKIPADHVLSQDPEPGMVLRRQRAVRVRVSDGQRDPVVPPVVDMPERTAEFALSGDSITVGDRAEIRTATYEPGVVVAQDPPAKQRSAKVALLVNRGDKSVSYVMPDLIGTLGVRSQDVLRGQGFRVAVVAEVPYPGLPPGIIVRQSPQAGYQVKFGEAITLEVTK